MKKRTWAVLSLLALGVTAATIALLAHRLEHEKLFFALQIEEGGVILARPKLLGETGLALSMRLVDPEEPERTRLALELLPSRTGRAYHVEIALEIPGKGAQISGELELMHGEERHVNLSGTSQAFTVTMLLMRVDSPEFDAYMELARRELESQAS